MERVETALASDDGELAPATCLGCGCLCDDLRIAVADGRITALENACPKGIDWFGDGARTAVVRCGDEEASFDDAVSAAATLLFAEPGRLLVYVADDLACETHREATALADRTGATIDGVASDTVADGLLAAQRRGRASATLGELRHRADIVVFWGVDPDRRCPRFLERFVTPLPAQPASRSLVAVDIEGDRGPAGLTDRLSLNRHDEVDALRVMQATLLGRNIGSLPPQLAAAAALATRLASGPRYIAFVFDAEGDERQPADPGRTEGLIALAQVLNGPTRAALFALRDGGNRNGFESLLTWQTGFPFAVDFATGVPVCKVRETVAARIERGRYAAALVLGSPSTVPPRVADALQLIPSVVIGPKASGAVFRPAVVIETGAAGLHEGGLVLRMDDVPLPVQPLLTHAHSATDVVRRLARLAPARRREVR